VSPVGITLLGLTEGQETTWQLSDGRPRRTRLVRVVFQPEAAGRHDL
jgi:transcription elongation GreA/GreB family factor